MRSVDYTETGFTSHTDLFFVQYSVNNNVSQSNNKFNLQNNVVKDNRIWYKNYTQYFCNDIFLFIGNEI
jgi:hypothetical protein